MAKPEDNRRSLLEAALRGSQSVAQTAQVAYARPEDAEATKSVGSAQSRVNAAAGRQLQESLADAAYRAGQNTSRKKKG